MDRENPVIKVGKLMRCICGRVFMVMLLLSLLFSNAAFASDAVERAGDILQVVLPASGAGIALALNDRDGLTQLAKSGALTLALTFGMKYTIPATRPDGGDHSFPSGHTSITFSSAEFIRERYGWNYGLPAYVAASGVQPGCDCWRSNWHREQFVIYRAI
jgi:membrane-associated phospholipid phosphatase